MADALETLFNEDNSEPVEKPEATASTDGPVRDDKGRFAPVAAEPVAPTPAITPEPVQAAHVATPAPEPVKAEPGHVPLAALLDEREKRKDLEKRVAAFEANRQPAQPPSLQSPEEIQAYVQRETANAAWAAKANFSEFNAREKHGDAAVEVAFEWCTKRVDQEVAALGFSPFATEQMRERHPVDWLVRQHKRDSFVNEIGDDPEAYRARVRAEIAAEAAQPAAPQGQPAPASPQPAAPKPAPPRPSLASAVSAGGMQTVPVVAPFEATFKG